MALTCRRVAAPSGHAVEKGGAQHVCFAGDVELPFYNVVMLEPTERSGGRRVAGQVGNEKAALSGEGLPT
jgi:hypothetical protein